MMGMSPLQRTTAKRRSSSHAQRLPTWKKWDSLLCYYFTKLTLVFQKLDIQAVNEINEDIAAEIMASAPHAKVENIYIMKELYMMKARFADHASATNQRGSHLPLQIVCCTMANTV